MGYPKIIELGAMRSPILTIFLILIDCLPLEADTIKQEVPVHGDLLDAVMEVDFEEIQSL